MTAARLRREVRDDLVRRAVHARAQAAREMREEPQGRLVLGQRDAGEAADPASARGVLQRLAQRNAETLALEAIADEQGDLRRARIVVVAHPPPDADQCAGLV